MFRKIFKICAINIILITSCVLGHCHKNRPDIKKGPKNKEVEVGEVERRLQYGTIATNMFGQQHGWVTTNCPKTSIKIGLCVLDNKCPGSVTIKIFYETLCGYCIALDPVFVKVAVELYDYIHVATYPYGNAIMTTNSDGSITVTCQHGEPECYGNKLHACSLDIIEDTKLALQYNACMMPLRSNDTAAVQCGNELDIPSVTVKRIMNCAKCPKGDQLHINYGKETDLVDFEYVPFVTINGAEWTGKPDTLKRDVCAAFPYPNLPDPCLEYE